MASDSLIEQKEREVAVNGHDIANKDSSDGKAQVNGDSGAEHAQTNGESKTESSVDVKDEQKGKQEEGTANEKEKKDSKVKPVVRYDE